MLTLANIFEQVKNNKWVRQYVFHFTYGLQIYYMLLKHEASSHETVSLYYNVIYFSK